MSVQYMHDNYAENDSYPSIILQISSQNNCILTLNYCFLISTLFYDFDYQYMLWDTHISSSITDCPDEVYFPLIKKIILLDTLGGYVSILIPKTLKISMVIQISKNSIAMKSWNCEKWLLFNESDSVTGNGLYKLEETPKHN